MTSAPDRRSVLLGGLTGLVAAGAAGCSAGSGSSSPAPAGSPAPVGAHTITRRFRGRRQAGIVEDPPTYAAFVGLDLASGVDKAALRGLFTVWTDDIERLMAGRPPLTDLEPDMAAVPAGLTVTVGVGPRTVEVAGKQGPAWLRPLPAFPEIDKLQDRWSGGDLFLQVCAADPNTVAHATRKIITAAGPLVRVAWIQRGFREAFTGPGVPMRNLFGQVDGTIQPSVAGPDDALLFATAGNAPNWLVEGSGVVVRRISMNLDVWDTVDLEARENSIGRRLSSGEPLAVSAGSGPGATADFTKTDAYGFPVIDEASHMARARGTSNPPERILRRPYSYDDAPEPGSTSNAGLIFVAYAADIDAQFLPIQRRLASKDLLNIWTTPIGSAVFAVLPGAGEGEILGAKLLA